MINILLSGVSGAMGGTLQQIIAANPDTQVVAGFDQQALTTLPLSIFLTLRPSRPFSALPGATKSRL